MTGRAYLVGHVDITTSPPVLRAAGIYSSSARRGLTSAMHREFLVDIWQFSGDDYGDAHRRAEAAIAESPAFAWVRPLLDRRAA